MPKRRRLLTPMRKKSGNAKLAGDSITGKDLSTATPRGRLKGALLDALDTVDDYYDEYKDTSPVRTPEHAPSSSPERPLPRPNHQPYVLKLFDRSVDLSQFNEDSPLYPICRAWMANQPKADYSRFGKKYDIPKTTSDIVLPGPEGPVISRIPELLPEQQDVDKDNIDLNYTAEDPLPTRDDLLAFHLTRWTNVREAWLKQAHRAEGRYSATQSMLSSMMNANNNM